MAKWREKTQADFDREEAAYREFHEAAERSTSADPSCPVGERMHGVLGSGCTCGSQSDAGTRGESEHE
jgi:hypothetical protein